MGLTAWVGPRGVFSSGEAAHIFGSGSVQAAARRRSENTTTQSAMMTVVPGI
jgi:hypothetical protein